MKIKRFWKKIAVLVMTTAFLLQGAAVTAAETETAAAETVETTAETKEAKAAPQTEAPQTEAPQTEAPQTEAPQTEAPQTEAPQTEAPQTEAAQTETEAETEAEETETEEKEKEKEEKYKTEFRFENGEVIIEAKATKAAKLPETTEMKVKKLEAGSPEYEEAKRASEEKLGVSEDAEYIFYDVTFVAEGKELDPAEGTVVVQVEFKTIQMDGTAQQQSVLQIDETSSGKVAKDVTAAGPEGSNMSSVKFAF